MSFSLGSVAAGLGSLFGSASGNTATTVANAWATNSARESLNKNITKTNFAIQKKYDLWTQQQDKLYEQWYQDYMYGLQNNQYYKLAQKYATNTAKWAVQGLKAAGLNPILAALQGNMSSNLGSAHPQPSGHSTSSGRVGSNAPASAVGSNLVGQSLAEALQSFSAADMSKSSARLKDIQSDIADKTKYASIEKAALDTDITNAQLTGQINTNEQIAANTAESQARAAVSKAQALNIAVDTLNKARNSGLDGWSGFLARFTHEYARQWDPQPGDSELEHHVSRSLGATGETQHSAQSDPGLLLHVSREGMTPWYRRPIEDLQNGRNKRSSDVSHTLDSSHRSLERTSRLLRRR